MEYVACAIYYSTLIIGNPEKARQIILSILHHISNSHNFPGFTLFPKCAHGPIEVQKSWIDSGLHLYLN